MNVTLNGYHRNSNHSRFSAKEENIDRPSENPPMAASFRGAIHIRLFPARFSPFNSIFFLFPDGHDFLRMGELATLLSRERVS